MKKLEISIPVDEESLLKFLLDRYGSDVLDIGILPENSIIRDFTITPDGKCVFRVCTVIDEDIDSFSV